MENISWKSRGNFFRNFFSQWKFLTGSYTTHFGGFFWRGHMCILPEYGKSLRSTRKKFLCNFQEMLFRWWDPVKKLKNISRNFAILPNLLVHVKIAPGEIPYWKCDFRLSSPQISNSLNLRRTQKLGTALQLLCSGLAMIFWPTVCPHGPFSVVWWPASCLGEKPSWKCDIWIYRVQNAKITNSTPAILFSAVLASTRIMFAQTERLFHTQNNAAMRPGQTIAFFAHMAAQNQTTKSGQHIISPV